MLHPSRVLLNFSRSRPAIFSTTSKITSTAFTPGNINASNDGWYLRRIGTRTNEQKRIIIYTFSVKECCQPSNNITLGTSSTFTKHVQPITSCILYMQSYNVVKSKKIDWKLSTRLGWTLSLGETRETLTLSWGGTISRVIRATAENCSKGQATFDLSFPCI